MFADPDGLDTDGPVFSQWGHGRPARKLLLSLTAPNTPPCILIICSAAVWLPGSVGAAAVGQKQALEAAIVGISHRCMDADIGGDAGQDEVGDAARAQDQLQVGRVEATFAGLVDHDLTGQGRQIRNDLPPRFAAGEDASAGAGIADAGADLAGPPSLVGGQIGQVGAMAFACMDDGIAARPQRRKDLGNRTDRCSGQRQVVAHLVDIAADATEIGLHIDDDDGGVLRLQ